MPRTRRTEQLSLRVTPEIRQELEVASKEIGSNVSEVLRRALERWIADRKPEVVG